MEAWEGQGAEVMNSYIKVWEIWVKLPNLAWVREKPPTAQLTKLHVNDCMLTVVMASFPVE
jgi:hypothetical protein